MDDPTPADSPTGVTEKTGLPSIAPDVVEQDQGDEFDNIVPSHGYGMLPMVGLGGSAGSIPALQRFFAAMRPDSGMAFVVVMHLAPEHGSIMDEIIARSTAMPVVQAQDEQKVEANTVYVIPPGQFLSASNGQLRLSPIELEQGRRVAVDLFFRTLADTYGPNAAAIILSGADGDGALGIKRIKERGGLTIAQSPEEAEHPSMPRSAIDTGMVDWILPVAEMPARLLEYRANAARLKLPAEEGPHPAKAPPTSKDGDEDALREVLTHLRSRTGRDFSYYKRATVVRRISRRMQVNSVATMPEYLGYLRTHPGESGALMQDLLISVTNFFRDREAFEALEAEIPRLFASKGPADSVRVWTAGCATGEEAYSVAMLLLEQAGRMDAPPALQVFATDLAEEAIASARDGLYPLSSQADVSEERLRRFFTKEHRGFRARRELRECVLFAAHDLLKDAPFSRMDLFTCRNLLIYLTPEAQKRVFNIAHFALRPGGLLFIGTSEAVDEENGQWNSLDKKHRLYRQRPGTRPELPVPIGPGTLTRAFEAQERARGGPYILGAAFTQQSATAVRQSELEHEGRKVSWEELHFKLIERFAPPSLIVTRDYDIVHVSENAGRFLHFHGGEPSVNLLKVVHPMLRVELRAALFRAAQTSLPVEVFRQPVTIEKETLSVDIRVAPAQEIAPDYLLVVFAVRETNDSLAVQTRQENEPAVRDLERENEQLKLRLRDTVEQYEASLEEQKASTEELQAMNEELRSSAEELETSREELQSVNEELTTVNQELKSKVDDLGHANSDLSNLMSANGVATIFLDRALSITRYTPTAVTLFRLIATDVGRPLTDLTHRLNYPELREDAERVLETLAPCRREVSDGQGWFLARLLPYRTGEDRIAGVVLTFMDITETRHAEQAVRASEQKLRTLADAVPQIIWANDAAGKANYFNHRWYEYTGLSFEESVVAGWQAVVHPDDELASKGRWQKAQAAGEVFDTEYRLRGADGQYRWFIGRNVPVCDEERHVTAWFGTATDIQDLKETTAALRASEERLRLVVENAREYAIFSMDLERRITSWNRGAEVILLYTEEEALGQSGDMIFTAEDRAEHAPELEAATAITHGRAGDERWHVRQDGSRFWGSGVMMAMHDARGQAIGLVKIFRDHTEQLLVKERLEQSKEELWVALNEADKARGDAEAAGQAKDHFLAVLSHELRTPLTPVLMATQTLERRKDLPVRAQEALAMIRRNILIESRFVDELLDITKIERGKMELLRAPMDMHEAIEHAVEVSRPDIVAKEQRLTVELKAREHRLEGDFPRLQQAVWNLLKNASKFTPHGGAIRLHTRNEAGALIMEVTDSGIGIAPEAAAHIFDPFTQADAAITREYGGLGLGLAIAKASVLGHGGEIRVKSEGLGRGAAFIVSLPLASGGNSE